jgi:hypothetical protein
MMMDADGGPELPKHVECHAPTMLFCMVNIAKVALYDEQCPGDPLQAGNLQRNRGLG